MTGSETLAQSDSVTVVAGARYEAGALQRLLLGTEYRDLWTTSFTAPVLDLATFAGGLTPVSTGGNLQTLALRFEGADGWEYNFRSIDKELTPALPSYARETLVDWIRQDQTSAQLPVAPVVASALLDAAGVLNPGPQVVVLPDDPALGEFREQYAGLLGTIEVHANENLHDPTKVFAGAARVAGTDRVLEHLEEDGPSHRIDSSAFLAARLMDVFLGDYDRHAGQWRWARFDGDSTHSWVPIPEDRDYAFVVYDGLLPDIAKRAALERLIRFSDSYSNLLGIMANSLDLNRRLLADLPRTTWDSVAGQLQTALTDKVIEQAVLTMPSSYFEQIGPELIRTLRARRDGLLSMADDYYELMARAVEIYATDEDERAVLRREPGGQVSVRVYASKDASAPYYARTFHPSETDEVRLYLQGGDDTAEITGNDGSIVLRVIGGGGTDTLEDQAAGRTVFYDEDADTEFLRGPATAVNTRPYEPPDQDTSVISRQRRDWGRSFTFLSPRLDWDQHADLVLGGGPAWTRYGFRHDPYRSRAALRLLYAPAPGRFGIEYQGDYRRENSQRRLEVLAHASNIEATRFHGFGNDTPDRIEQQALVWERKLQLRLDWVFPFARQIDVRVGPHFSYSDPDPPAGSPVATLQPLGTDGFGTAGLSAALDLDTRDDAVFTRRGVHATTVAKAALSTLDDDPAYGRFGGSVAAFLSLPGEGSPVLALRAGGERALGNFPYPEAAFLGGSRTLRGFPFQRFAGDGVVHGTAEVRVPVLPAKLILRGRLGTSLFVDAGRVYHDGVSNGGWHTRVGGGVWFATPVTALALNFARGDHDRVYLQLGMPF